MVLQNADLPRPQADLLRVSLIRTHRVQSAQRAQQFQGVLVGPYRNRYFWLQFARHHLWVLGHRPIWARPLPLEPALGSSPLLALAEFQMLLEELGFEKARDQDLYHSAAIRQNGPLHRYGTFGLS